MKKILIGILTVLLVALAISVWNNGISIGDFSVLGFSELGSLNDELDNKLEKATTLTTVTFDQKRSSLNAALKGLSNKRDQYQEKVAYSSEEDVRRANEIETYEVDFLFARLGNYAKKYGIEIDLDAKLTSASGVYNLNITAHGKYALIAEFVSAVENDSELTFKIENFILTPDVDSNTEILRAQFVVNNIRLDVDESIKNSSTDVPMNGTAETSAGKNENSTKNVNTNKNTNTSTNNTNTNTNNNTNNNTNTGATTNSNTNT